MSDRLLREIQRAQVEAAEDAVVENLRRKGLLPPSSSVAPTNLREFPARTGIVIDLDYLRDLMREFIDEYPPDNPSRTEYEWRFSTFLYWLQKRMETTNEKSAN